MAEDKKSYIGYVDWGDTFDMLTDIQAGKLIKHFYSYIRDENPVLEDQILKLAFHPIKLQLKRDLRTWESQKEKRSQAGKKGMEKRWSTEKPITKDNGVINGITKITVNDNVTVNVNDNVTVNESVISDPTLGMYAVEGQKLFTVDHCGEVAMKDSSWVQDSGATLEKIEAFKKKLKGEGTKEKNIIDFKKHFFNWNKLQTDAKFNGTSKATFKGRYEPTGTGGY